MTTPNPEVSFFLLKCHSFLFFYRKQYMYHIENTLFIICFSSVGIDATLLSHARVDLGFSDIMEKQ